MTTDPTAWSRHRFLGATVAASGLAVAGLAGCGLGRASSPDPEEEGETSPRASLSERLETLSAGRMAGLGHLPLARALQNADAVAADRLDQTIKAVQAWREDWRKALGLDAKRPRRVQPDPTALAGVTARLNQVAASTEAMLTDGRARRSRALGRLEELRRAVG